MHGLQMLQIQPGEHVLEIGCGTGESLPVLNSCVDSMGRIFGLDLSAGMLGIAKNKVKRLSLSNVDFLQGDGLHLPFPDKSLDAIFMSFTLELLPATEIPFVLQECKRVLRDDGRIGIVTLLQKEDPGWMDKLYTWAHYRWPHVIDCRPIPIESIVRNAGFENSRLREMSMWGLAIGILVATKIPVQK